MTPEFFALIIAAACLYGLYQGFKGFWSDSKGQRPAAIFMLLLSPVLIFIMIKLIDAGTLPLWGILLTGFGLFWLAMWIGQAIFPNSSMFKVNDKTNDKTD